MVFRVCRHGKRVCLPQVRGYIRCVNQNRVCATYRVALEQVAIVVPCLPLCALDSAQLLDAEQAVKES